MGEEADGRHADPPGGQGALRRSRHAYGDIGLAAEQVFLSVREIEFDDHFGMGFMKARQDRRQYLGADDVAGRHPHHAARLIGLARGGAQQGFGGAGHGLGMGLQRQGGFSGPQTPWGTGEEDRAQRRLQRLDLPSDRRLGQAKRASRTRQAAGVEDGQEGAVEVPVRSDHTEMYNRSTDSGNSV